LGVLEYESIGMKCTKCKGFIDMHGNFHKYVEKPFMPPETNFDKITESVESLAKWLCENYGVMMPECVPCKATINEVCEFQCEDCLIEWLQKEIKDENI
jgi:hypothetical protein